MIAENILREPENPKYQTFKRENDLIKRRLIEPKGALEYALAVSVYFGASRRESAAPVCLVVNDDARPSLWGPTLARIQPESESVVPPCLAIRGLLDVHTPLEGGGVSIVLRLQYQQDGGPTHRRCDPQGSDGPRDGEGGACTAEYGGAESGCCSGRSKCTF